MPALAEEIYSFLFEANGPSNINIVFDLVVDGVDSYITFVGFRARAWAFPHNWLSAINETLEYLTDFKKTRTGFSQRASLRRKPHRAFSYKFLLTSDERQKLENLLFKWQGKPWQVPFLTSGTLLTAQASISATTLVCDTTDRGFVDGGAGLLVSFDGRTNEPVAIDTVSSGSVTLLRALAATWPANSVLYPAGTGYIVGNVALTRQRVNAVSGAVTFKMAPVETDSWIPDTAAPVTYNGYEVLTTQPDWGDGITGEGEFDYDYYDYGTGPAAYFSSAEYGSKPTQYKLLFRTRAEIAAFRAFLGRCRGRTKAFYCPSWNTDLTPVLTIGVGDTTIRCTDNGFNTLVGVDPARAHIFIETRDGATYYRAITSSTPTGSDVIIGISSALGVAYTSAQIKRISYMPLFVHASDKFNLEWRSAKVATVNINLVDVPE